MIIQNLQPNIRLLFNSKHLINIKKGTEALVLKVTETDFTVAWDLPDRPLRNTVTAEQILKYKITYSGRPLIDTFKLTDVKHFILKQNETNNRISTE
jgi:hypothetical protein